MEKTILLKVVPGWSHWGATWGPGSSPKACRTQMAPSTPSWICLLQNSGLRSA